MDKRLDLVKHGKQLWTRDLAVTIRGDLEKLLEQSQAGDAVIIDAKDVDVFDYSFANELFGKTILRLAKEHPERFLVVENLNVYTRENLANALSSLGLVMIEKKGGKIQLIGKVHPADQETFNAIVSAKDPVTANDLKDKLGINLNAMNERLSKLSGFALIRRNTGVSSAGREQYRYSVLR